MRFKLVTGALLLALAAPAHAEDWDFVLVNKTGKTIKAVELAPSGSESWFKWKTEEDKASTIKPGVDFTVPFSKDPKACQFDVKLIFEDNSSAVARGLNVCNYAFADFSLKDGVLAVKGS
jgi:hypothetical protein